MAKNIPSSIERLIHVAHYLSDSTIEFKGSLREAENPGRSLGVIDQNGERVEYQVYQFMSCDSSELEATRRNNLIPNMWIFVGGQQGAFGVLHVESLTHLRFVQITVGQKHSFFLDVIDGLLRRACDDGQPWDRRDYRNNVNYKLLDWTEG